VAAPATDGEVVAVAEGFGDGDAEKLGGTGVVGIVEQACGGVGGAGRGLRGGLVAPRRSRSSAARRMTILTYFCIEGCVAFAEAFVAGGVGVAEDAGEEADGGVEEDGGGELTAGEDVVARWRALRRRRVG